MAKKRSSKKTKEKEAELVDHTEKKISIEEITDAANETDNEEVSPDSDTKEEGTPEDELIAAKQRAAEASEQYVRLLAEFDNFRKRSRREASALAEYASEKVLTALLPVLDDFDRTLTAMEKTDNLSSIKDGIILVTNKLHSVLEKSGLNVIDTAGAEFDTELHEAIHSMEVPDEKKGKVLEEAEKGYRLKDKVIRYSKVIVGE